jgi:hypothetical protein
MPKVRRKHNIPAANLNLEVHERDPALVEEGREDLVDPEAQLLAELQILVRDA